MTTRVFVPSSWSGLREVVLADGIGPAPFVGHAVTPGLRSAYAEGGEDELAYAATAAAARSSLAMLAGQPPRRVVLAVDAEAVVSLDEDDPTAVEVGEVVPFRRIAAVLVDDASAAADVSAAVAAWPDAETGGADAEAVVGRCLDHELCWYATQEVADLLEQE